MISTSAAEKQKIEEIKRELVLPGDLIELPNLKPGSGTFVDAGKIYSAQLGIKSIRANYINIVPLGGRYMPKLGDTVIGIVIDITPTNWLVDINSPYLAPLHVNETPWKVEFGETSKYLNVGDCALLEILSIDDIRRVHLTMNGLGLRKLVDGQIVEISPSKVPRVIGKGGSMINMIKNYTKCRMFVGQNGRIWIDGNLDKIAIATFAIKKIDKESQVIGLTESLKKLLETYGGSTE
jgi:exosome complex component RRP4